MFSKSFTSVALAALALCASTVQAATTNGFANGGFEIGQTTVPGPMGPEANVNPTNAQGWVDAAAGYSRSSDARTGSFAAELASPAFNAAVMLQNSVKEGGLPALTVGDTPTFSFWAKGSAGGTGNVLFALRYLDPTGNILANSGNRFFQGSINTSSWTQITYNLGAVPTGATAAFVEFSQGIGPINNTDLPAGRVLIDDLYLGVTAVPEPGTYALMLAGLAAVGAMVRRRRAA